jgi:RNA polymerase sigma-70 factor (ECF subfamily)
VHERYVKTPTYADVESYSLDDQLIAEETAILIDIAIERMPPQRKKIFEMSRLEGLKSTEIAEQLNLSRHTVDNHLAAAKKDLRDLLTLFAFLFLGS